ncbi:MAG: membrane protein insertase YidC [Lentisphaerae bacterium]|nr:membrane protein insertase YidC [Lentisphaerota bacterium]
MNKQDITIVVLLFLGLLGWGYYQRRQALLNPPAPPAASAAAVAGSNRVDRVEPRVLTAASDTAPTTAPAPVAAAAVPATAKEPVRHERPEQTLLLTNAITGITVSSWGGGVTRVELSEYKATVASDSGPVILDLSSHPALSLVGLAGFSVDRDYELRYAPEGNAVLLTCSNATGLVLERRLELGDHYRLKMVDTFINRSEAPVALPEYALALGPMQAIQTKASTRGQTYLGLDTLEDKGGASVETWAKGEHWWKKTRGGLKSLPQLFGGSSGGCSRNRMPIDMMPLTVSQEVATPQTWVAAKNKFFVQIMAPEEPATSCMLQAARDPEAEHFAVNEVSAEVVLSSKVIAPGETLERGVAYYVGPKKFSILKTLGARQDEVMLYAWWGWFRWLCRVLLATLNGLYAVIPNYGVAIILLTAIVRILFWPITHKSTQSMKEMQKVQPLVKEIREKYKDKPQKMNQEVMALYKVHKINPMAGCLPIVVQMPVFIALFTVLRSAVELRFGSFLWIADLSEPEGLWAGAIPFPAGGINILPFFMAATMFWQQKLTPSGGDPQQQKMMQFMPLFMLFMFYSMPSALVLYWSVSQGFSIAQMLHSKRLTAKAEEGK